MATRHDFGLDNDGDLLFANGDITIVESDKQHIVDTCNAFVGWWKEFPLDGVGIGNFSKSVSGAQQLARKVKIELEKDGYKVDNPVVEFDEEGKLNLYPNASI